MATRFTEYPQTIELGKETLAYFLSFSPRRTTIGMRIENDGLHVVAPSTVSQTRIDTVLNQHATWILNKLARKKAALAKQPPAHTDYREGDTLPWLGQTLTLAVSKHAHAYAKLRIEKNTLHVQLPQTMDHLPGEALTEWIKRYARAYLGERLKALSQHTGLNFSAFSLTSAKSKWGSCAASGKILLHWRLMFCDPSLIDYTIIHELSHTQEMNHSARFWHVVEQFCPNYKKLRRQLREYSNIAFYILPKER